MAKAERPSHFPDPQNPFLVAARYNDAEVTEDTDFGVWCERHDIDTAALIHTAEQRAMRYAMQRTGDTEALDEVSRKNVLRPFQPTPEQRAIMEFVMPAVMDGIALGWRARIVRDSDT